MATIGQLLENKGKDVATIDKNASVYDAIKMMSDKNIGSVIVKCDNKICGIVTERHYAREVFLKGRSSSDTAVGDIMSTRVVCAWPEQTVHEAMAVMTEKKVRHLPVLDHKELIGIVSIGDLVKRTIKDQKFIIEQLEHYISG